MENRMKYYRLTKDLPTFKKGQIFYLNEYGSLVCDEGNIIAYSWSTIDKFPNILKDWFEEVPAPARDAKTKAAFEAYLTLHPEQRFFQAVRNFANDYLCYEGLLNCIASIKAEDYSEQNPPVDTFYWECDDMLKEKEEDDELSDEEQRADKY
jgi:hypothetical protein